MTTPVEDRIAGVADAIDDLEPTLAPAARVRACTMLVHAADSIARVYDLTPRQQTVLRDLRREILDLAMDALR